MYFDLNSCNLEFYSVVTNSFLKWLSVVCEYLDTYVGNCIHMGMTVSAINIQFLDVL